MRTEVARLVEEGRSEDDIRAIFVARYGERILTEPEGAKGVVLYAAPLLLMLCSAGGMAHYLKRAVATSPSILLPDSFLDEIDD
jgi:cytochrome c-type biogenesis protein CcmH/NrfF